MQNFKNHWFLSWPVIGFVWTLSFLCVFLGIMPYFNAVGYLMYSSFGEAAALSYFQVPFTALNVCILLGYFRLAKILGRKLDAGCERLFTRLARRARNHDEEHSTEKLERQAARAAARAAKEKKRRVGA